MTKDMKLSELVDELEAKYLAWKNIGDARILADRKRVEFAEACYAAMPAILTALRDSTDREAIGQRAVEIMERANSEINHEGAGAANNRSGDIQR